MLIPKFSISQMLLAMVGLAVVSAILADAARGGNVAIGLSLALAGLIVPAMVATLAYWLLFFLSSLNEKSNRG